MQQYRWPEPDSDWAIHSPGVTVYTTRHRSSWTFPGRITCGRNGDCWTRAEAVRFKFHLPGFLPEIIFLMLPSRPECPANDAVASPNVPLLEHERWRWSRAACLTVKRWIRILHICHWTARLDLQASDIRRLIRRIRPAQGIVSYRVVLRGASLSQSVGSGPTLNLEICSFKSAHCFH